MNMKMIPVIDGTLGTDPKGLEKRHGELEVSGRIGSMPIIKQLKSG